MAESARYRGMSGTAMVSRKIPTLSPRPTKEREKLILFLLSRVQAARHLPKRRDAPGEVRHHMVPERRVQRIAIVFNGIRRIKLVTVLAIDGLALSFYLKRGQVRESKLIYQPLLPQGFLNHRVPPDLRVVVTRQVNHALLVPAVKALKRREEPCVLRA